MKRTKHWTILAILLVIALTSSTMTAFGAKDKEKPEPYEEVWGQMHKNFDLSGYDFSDDYDLLTTLNYSKNTKWPSKDKMPVNFSPEKYMEWGKNPGLGLKELHKQGYTGKGVNVAYIDQPLGKTIHPADKNVDLHYYTDIMTKYKEWPDNTSMHGPAVLSLLAGKEIGVAPEASVYFVANPSWLTDQRSHADAIRKIIEENKKLPADKKIKIVGFSDNIDSSEKYPEEFEKAVKEAENEGICVIFANYGRAVAQPFSDRDNPENYTAISSGFKGAEGLYVPADRTTATQRNDYVKWSQGGTSWTTPYVLGLMAIGWQINPDLSAKELRDLMYQTVTKLNRAADGGLINPKGFVQAVKATVPDTSDYALFVYNSNKVSVADMTAIKDYAEDFPTDQSIKYLDTKDLSSAPQVYDKMNEIVSQSKGKLTGVQIFGTDGDVPAFNVNFKVQMLNGIDEGGKFKSDYFYGNLNNDGNVLEGMSIYSTFADKLNIDFVPKWPVVRLPLTKGDYARYFEKYNGYNQAMNSQKRLQLVSFANPIFAQKDHSDDMSWFLDNRIKKEFDILSSKEYSSYGNLEGDFPVNGKVKGDFTAENMQKENQKGISDFLITSHGQKTNIDKAIFVNGKEKRISTLNTNNINTMLGSNYYNLMTWTCNNAEGLDTGNLAYKALADSKAVNVFAATAVLSNNGVNNKASLTKMKKNNFYYFYYSFMKYYYGGMNRSDSFWLAKRDYTESILYNSKELLGEGNYQFSLHNVLTYEHLGLLRYQEPVMGEGITISKAGKLIKGTAYMPAKTALNSLGYTVAYDKKTKKLTAIDAETGKKIIITANKKTAAVNGAKKTLSVTPKLSGSSIYVTAGTMKKLTGQTVKWNKTTKTFIISDTVENGHKINYLVKVK